MIEMQYNFPLLPGQAVQWRERLSLAVAGLDDEDADEMRPTFRGNVSGLIKTGARWMDMPAERTFLTEGGHHGSLLAMIALGMAGQAIAVDVAAYTGALEQAKAFGSPLVPCAVDEEGMVPASLDAQCVKAATAGKPIRAAYVIPTVHNPLGCVASLARRQDLVAVSREHGLYFIEDDAYGYMAPDAPPSLARLAPERTFYIRSLSKSYAPAARAGYLVAPHGFEDRMWTAVKNVVTGVSLPHARAAASLVEDGTLDKVIASKNSEGLTRNRTARDLLGDDACWPGAPAAWHLWINLPANVTPQSFEQRMKDRGVLISGGNWFAAGSDAPNGFRAALGGEVEREGTLEGIQRLASALQEL